MDTIKRKRRVKALVQLVLTLTAAFFIFDALFCLAAGT